MRQQSLHGRKGQAEWKKLASDLRAIYGDELINEAWADVEIRVALLRFLDWLGRSAPGTISYKILRSFQGTLGEVFPASAGGCVDHSHHQRVFFDVFISWCRQFVSNPGDVKPITAVACCRTAAAAIERLSHRFPAIPNSFKANEVRLSQPSSDPIRSLGETKWPELDGLLGIDRERKALKILRQEFCKAYIEEENLFHAGQGILRGEIPDGADPKACARIQPLLLRINAILHRTGNLSPGALLEDESIRTDPALDVGLWRAAGFVVGSHTAVLRGPCLTAFVPTRRMVAAAVGVLICDTGWNRQPMLDLSISPFVFQSYDKAFLATPTFIQSFKKRAGHHVIARLGEVMTDRHVEEAQAAWGETVEMDGNPLNPHYAVLDLATESKHLSSVEILRRYRAVADITLAAVAGLPSARSLGRHFWIHSGEQGLMKPKRMDISWAKLSRKEVTYRGIRKTLQITRLDESGSVLAVSRGAGHTRTNVIMPHYLNAPHINAQLDQSIRDFQNAIQGLVTRELDQKVVATALQITEGNLVEMRRSADQSGITAALGLFIEDDNIDHVVFRFQASNDRLTELYLVHRALQELRGRTRNHARYRLRYLPMLAMVKAIGRELFQSGQGPRYVKLARVAHANLRRGEIALPFLGE